MGQKIWLSLRKWFLMHHGKIFIQSQIQTMLLVHFTFYEILFLAITNHISGHYHPHLWPLPTTLVTYVSNNVKKIKARKKIEAGWHHCHILSHDPLRAIKKNFLSFFFYLSDNFFIRITVIFHILTYSIMT